MRWLWIALWIALNLPLVGMIIWLPFNTGKVIKMAKGTLKGFLPLACIVWGSLILLILVAIVMDKAFP